MKKREEKEESNRSFSFGNQYILIRNGKKDVSTVPKLMGEHASRPFPLVAVHLFPGGIRVTINAACLLCIVSFDSIPSSLDIYIPRNID